MAAIWAPLPLPSPCVVHPGCHPRPGCHCPFSCGLSSPPLLSGLLVATSALATFNLCCAPTMGLQHLPFPVGLHPHFTLPPMVHLHFCSGPPLWTALAPTLASPPWASTPTSAFCSYPFSFSFVGLHPHSAFHSHLLPLWAFTLTDFFLTTSCHPGIPLIRSAAHFTSWDPLWDWN